MNAKISGLFEKLRSVVKDVEGLNEADTLAVLKSFCEDPPTEKITFPITLTPSGAELIDAYNTNNRNLNDNRTKSLCRSHERDNWEHTHQGIAMGFEKKNGKLETIQVDGQKRCAMVRRTGIPAKVDITFGLSTEVFHAIDDTQPRAPAQTFVRTEGRLNANSQVAVVRSIARVAGGMAVKLQTTDDIEDWRSAFSSQIDWAMDHLVGLKPFRKAELIAAMAVIRVFHAEEAEDFIHQVKTGEKLTLGDPALTLRNSILTEKEKNTRKGAGGNNPMLVVQRTLNAFLSYQRKEKLQRAVATEGAMQHFRKLFEEKKRVRELLKFWKRTGAAENIEEEPGKAA